jgi:DNA mismatch repair ATPase MutL
MTRFTELSYLTITVDKAHIISIGERLYEQSIELIRELVNNAYDADATRVDVQVSDKEIVVSDNGDGMVLKDSSSILMLDLTTSL